MLIVLGSSMIFITMYSALKHVLELNLGNVWNIFILVLLGCKPHTFKWERVDRYMYNLVQFGGCNFQSILCNSYMIVEQKLWKIVFLQIKKKFEGNQH